MSTAGTIFNFIGNMGAASASRRAGDAQKAAAEFEAAQLNQAAGQAVAAAQRDAINERRRAALVVSRGLAVAAASGGGAFDPTVINLLADIEGEGAYRAGVALYQGEERWPPAFDGREREDVRGRDHGPRAGANGRAHTSSQASAAP